MFVVWRSLRIFTSGRSSTFCICSGIFRGGILIQVRSCYRRLRTKFNAVLKPAGLLDSIVIRLHFNRLRLGIVMYIDVSQSQHFLRPRLEQAIAGSLLALPLAIFVVQRTYKMPRLFDIAWTALCQFSRPCGNRPGSLQE